MENLDKSIQKVIQEQLRTLLSPHEVLAKIQKEAQFALFGSQKNCDTKVYGLDLNQLDVTHFDIDKAKAPLYKVRNIQFTIHPLRIGVIENGYMQDYSNNLIYAVEGAVLGMELQATYNYKTEKHDFKVLAHDLEFAWFKAERV